ncbi:MAG: GGDEF domain-containing protein [Thermodesulfobacteriota bacterium]|nr:GGDEF domain-containing protein [Thermodesulfobacteriota bacterium]
MSIRKKKVDLLSSTKELADKSVGDQSKEDFLIMAIQSLLFYIKEFSLDLKEIDAEGFKKEMDDLSGKLLSEKRTKKLEVAFEKYQRTIKGFIKLEKEYFLKRDSEFKSIVELLTKAIASISTENEDFNQRIYKQTEKIEKITLLDDIKKIRTDLAQEIERMRETISEKQLKESKEIETLSGKVSSLKAELQKVKKESLRDGLTGIYNRLAFDKYMGKLVTQKNLSRSRFSMLMLDIDDFKKINDTFGHKIGDRVLLALVQKCKGNIRREDFLARYGGEEFVIILPQASLKNAMKKANAICKSVAGDKYTMSDDKGAPKLTFTVSIGVSTFRKDDTADSVIVRADEALYEAKKSGKNRFVCERG